MIAEKYGVNQGDRDLRPAWKEIKAPGTKDRIVLISPDLDDPNQPFPNLLRRDSDDRIVWTAPLPAWAPAMLPDSYVDVRWEGAELVATSFYGVRTRVNPKTGELVAQEFTK
jgi:hypothetical protein